MSSRTPSLTPSRSSSPLPLVQPDHFYGSEDIQFPSPSSNCKTWLDPSDDPLARRGIPVFKPTMEDFQDFESYVTKIECWGTKSGIVKVIPPKEWKDALPPLKAQLSNVQIKSPIEQHMLGSGGLFRQENMEKRRFMTLREWAELCAKDDFRAPGVQEVRTNARGSNGVTRFCRRPAKKSSNGAKKELSSSSVPPISIKKEPLDQQKLTLHAEELVKEEYKIPTLSIVPALSSFNSQLTESLSMRNEESSTKPNKRTVPRKEAREAALAKRFADDSKFLETFEPHEHWLPPNTTAEDYTREFCQALERRYWRNCGISRSAWYGADTQGSLFTEATTSWNVANLPSTLSRLLPASNRLPGVNTPYLYFGMWRATFAWHVEDMDLFSINYIHFGAPKFWYAIPQGRASALEQTMRGYFPKDTTYCPQFLRHKSFLASPTLLAQSSCRPNSLVQQCGEFVITFPRGYHAGFNLGLNCAESVNFALESWLELGRRAQVCKCVPDSVRIDVDQLMRARVEEDAYPNKPPKCRRPSSKKFSKNSIKAEDDICYETLLNVSRKRKSESGGGSPPKKIRIKATAVNSASSSKSPFPKLSLKVGLTEIELYPCCLCASSSREGLLRVHEPPIERKDAVEAAGSPREWFAHEHCACVVPETWVDEIERPETGLVEKQVFGVNAIVKDRWNLKCSACSKSRPKAHGAPIQCTKGKCSKAFHVTCARDGGKNGILFSQVREIEKEVVLVEPPCIEKFRTSKQEANSNLDGPSSADDISTTLPRFLKVIRKLEVQVLCAQHNPAVVAARKASKMDRIKSELLSYSPMTRIKIRVSAGVFEVSLIRVIEETGAVEVLWDHGVKREFKWGSVVFGNTDGPVQQKPSEITSGPTPNGLPVETYASVDAATASFTHNAVLPRQVGIQETTSYIDWYRNLQFGPAQPPFGYWYQNAAHISQYNPYVLAQQSYQLMRHGSTNDQQVDRSNVVPEANNLALESKSNDLASQSQPDPAVSQIVNFSSQVPPPEPPLQECPSLAELSELRPDQIGEMLKQNTHFRDLVIHALNEAQKTLVQEA